RDARAWAEEVVGLGAGEILLNEIEHDGDKRGYDLELLRLISTAVQVPIIAFGGVGSWDHLVAGVREGNADAVAAGNIFHYTEHSTKKAKEYMAAAGLPVRGTTFYKVAMPRRPTYKPFCARRHPRTGTWITASAASIRLILSRVSCSTRTASVRAAGHSRRRPSFSTKSTGRAGNASCASCSKSTRRASAPKIIRSIASFRSQAARTATS